MKHLHTIYTIIFGLAVLLFFGLAYPHHLHYQEQFQLFLFDCSYVWEIVKLPGGIADLLGRFCTQFFLYAWVGALIIAILLSAIQLLTLRLANWGRCYGLSYIPSFLLWIFLLDENALLGGIWAVLLTLLAAWIIEKAGYGKVRYLLLIISIPVLYWIVGPISLILYLLAAPRPQRSTAIYYSLFVLLAIMIAILSSYLPVPAGNLWFGIHYYRYPTEIPTMLWLAAFSIFVLTLIVRICQRWANASNNHAITLCSFALIAIMMGVTVWKNANFKAEKVMQYDFMARYQQWNRVLETINIEKPNNQIGVTVQNLALAMHGMLNNYIFQYNQNGISGLLPDMRTDAISPLPTAEAFYQLGMISVAQRTVFEAQEAILDFQKSGRCYQRLAQTNLISGNYEVARKYLLALKKTLFYREWANETLTLLGNEEAIAKHPEYGRLRQMAYKEDFYFGGHVTPDMLEKLYFSNTGNRIAYEYLVAYYLLTGDRESYAKLLRQTR